MSEDAWPCFEVEIYGFGPIYVEAPTKTSARWFAVSKCHEAGYGRSPIELIQRGVSMRELPRFLAAIHGDIHRVKRLARKANP